MVCLPLVRGVFAGDRLGAVGRQTLGLSCGAADVRRAVLLSVSDRNYSAAEHAVSVSGPGGSLLLPHPAKGARGVPVMVHHSECGGRVLKGGHSPPFFTRHDRGWVLKGGLCPRLNPRCAPLGI